MAPGFHYRIRARAIQLTASPPSEDLVPPTIQELDGQSNMLLPQTQTRLRTLPLPQIQVTPASDTSSEVNFGAFSAADSESEANSTFTLADRFQSHRAEDRFVQDLTKKIVSGTRKASDPICKTPKVTAGTKRSSPEDADFDELAKRVALGVKEEVLGLVKRKPSTQFKKRSGEKVVEDLATRIVRGMRKASEEDLKFMKNMFELRHSKKTEVVTDSSADSPHVIRNKKSVGLGYRPTIPFYSSTKSGGRATLGYVEGETEGETDVAQTPPPNKASTASLRIRTTRADTDTDIESNRPYTTDFVARRMISQALGVKVEQKKDQISIAFRTALRMDKRIDRMSSWDEFLSKKDMNIYELQD